MMLVDRGAEAGHDGPMLGQARLMAFVATAQPERARHFYENVLGLRLLSDDPWAIVFDAGGTTLRVQKVESLRPVAHTALGAARPATQNETTVDARGASRC